MSLSTHRANPTAITRPSAITVIAGLELAAAAWNAHLFLLQESMHSGQGALSLPMLLPAIMAFAAVYAGVGLLKMRRDGWMVFLLRHAWLSGLYLLTLPVVAMNSVFYPALQAVLLWQFTIITFSAMAGAYLYGVRAEFDMDSAR